MRKLLESASALRALCSLLLIRAFLSPGFSLALDAFDSSFHSAVAPRASAAFVQLLESSKAFHLGKQLESDDLYSRKVPLQ